MTLQMIEMNRCIVAILYVRVQ